MMKREVRIVLSTGWIVPLFLGVQAVFSFLRNDVVPRLFGQTTLNSFLDLPFSKRRGTIGFDWLFLVVVFWAMALTRRNGPTSARPVASDTGQRRA